MGYRGAVFKSYCSRWERGVRPDGAVKLTRLACGKSEMPCLPECARMSRQLPRPPGSWPSQARGASRIPSGGATRISRPLDTMKEWG